MDGMGLYGFDIPIHTIFHHIINHIYIISYTISSYHITDLDWNEIWIGLDRIGLHGIQDGEDMHCM